MESPIVLTNSSSMIKAGFGGDDAPRAVFPGIVGRSKYPEVMVGMGFRDYYIGDEADSKRGILDLKYPVTRGRITNWDDMEKIWHHLFYNELRIAPEEHYLLVQDSFLGPKSDREKITQVLFETFNVKGLYMLSGIESALYSTMPSGFSLFVHIGHGSTQILPMDFDKPLIDYGIRQDFAGQDLDDFLRYNIVRENDIFFHSNSESRIIQKIKENLCYVTYDFEEELIKNTKSIIKQYELPDAKVINLTRTRFAVPEILFSPSMFGFSQVGLLPLIEQCVSKFPKSTQDELLKHIVVIGGSTMFPGFVDRFKKDLSKSSPNANVFADDFRKYSIWIGGSVISSLTSFSEKVIQSSQYDDQGPEVIHQHTKGAFLESERLFTGVEFLDRISPSFFQSQENICIIDQGTDSFKIGFSYDQEPKAIIPSIVGFEPFGSDKKQYIGEEAIENRELQLNPIFKEGKVENWEYLTAMYDYCFKSLGTYPDSTSLLLTRPLNSSNPDTEKMAQILMEQMKLPNLAFAFQPHLASYALDQIQTGIVVDIGNEFTQILPFYQRSYPLLSHKMPSMHYGGKHLTEQLIRLFRHRNYVFLTSAEFELAKYIKETYCYIARDFDQEYANFQTSTKEQRHIKLNGESILLDNESFSSLEPLFNPNLIGLSYPGIHQAIYDTIMLFDQEKQRELSKNIILCGGSSLIPNLVERLQTELSSLLPVNFNLNVFRAPDSDVRTLVWRGGAAFSKSERFSRAMFSSSDYFEIGSSVIYEKSFEEYF
ncbi:actin-7-related [Anaeramoeba ignava]|uniref:Actin-7-related n=1 Tax=Anaeramoeba ignava TaxID=1746090 RepID=A0A9Q0LUP3_ANAIG|nr:actin-7-related [Anaeramoeba ignava]